jgi:serpin B
LAGVVRGLSPRTVRLSLPRFRLTAQTELEDTLKSLGMTAAFSDAADFSGITSAAPLKINTVEHAADLSVDEEGNVAAAATGVGFIPVSAPFIPADAVRFNANHPFLFFLRDNSTGAVLFAGRLTNPATASPS